MKNTYHYLLPSALVLLGAISFISYGYIGASLLPDGTLVGPFWLIPVGYLCTGIGLVLGIVQSLRVHHAPTRVDLAVRAVCAGALFLAGVFLVAAMANIGDPSRDEAEPDASARVVEETQLANPASGNCIKVGGTLQMQKDGSGGEYGLCVFEDNRACEEWALFRGECPVGGRRTTGYDTIEQKYCAWLGGETAAEADAQCTLPSGTVCSAAAVYMGTCR